MARVAKKTRLHHITQSEVALKKFTSNQSSIRRSVKDGLQVGQTIVADYVEAAQHFDLLPAVHALLQLLGHFV